MIENILKYVQLAYIVLVTIAFIINLIKSKTTNKKTKEDCNKVLTFIFKAQNFISKAEQFMNWTNTERKQYVMAMLYSEGLNCGMDETDIDNLVENLVAFLNTRIKKENKEDATVKN